MIRASMVAAVHNRTAVGHGDAFDTKGHGMNDSPDRYFPPLTVTEVRKTSDQGVWRTMMLREERRQSLALERLAEILGDHTEELRQIRQHFETWAPEET